jgi:serine/threonine-protein kinase
MAWVKLILRASLLGLLVFYITLNLSVKGGKVAMPDLKGQYKGVAERKLGNLGLKMEVREERFSSEAPYGVVLWQEFEPGLTLKKGRSVELILSKGTKHVAVPELSGQLSRRQGELLLEQNGLKVGRVSEVSHALPAGVIIAQSPSAGARVARGHEISLLVSKGPAPQAWVMPDLKGQNITGARATLAAMGLVLRHVDVRPRGSSAPGVVLEQTLAPGWRVEAGEVESLAVAAGAAPLEGARLVNIEYVTPDDQRADRRVRVVITDDQGERVAHNAMVAPGGVVRLETRAYGKASYTVFLAGAPVLTQELP